MRPAAWSLLAALTSLAAAAGTVVAQTESPPPYEGSAGSYAQPPVPPPAPSETRYPAFAPGPSAPSAPPPPAAPEPDAGWGRRHSSLVSLSLGVASGTGGTRYAGGAGFAYFVLTGVAPGADVSVNGGGGTLTTANVTGTLRLVPLRTGPAAFFLIGRAGRLFIADHADVWGAGGGAGVVIATGGKIGLQLSYEVLGLWPSGHCSDLVSGCRLDTFGLGLIMGF